MNSLAVRVAAVGAMSPTALKQAWTKQFGSEPPDWPSSLMARAITYAMQAKSPGGLSKRVTKYLDRVVDALETRVSADTVASITKVAPGTRMVREWHGRVYHVEAMRDGRFLFEGAPPYRSLTRDRMLAGEVDPENRHARRLVRLAYLSPAIVTAIVEGRQPKGMTAGSLFRMTGLPLDWAEQERMVLG